MTADSYFAGVTLMLTILIFTALALGFLYMVYGKDEETTEEE